MAPMFAAKMQTPRGFQVEALRVIVDDAVVRMSDRCERTVLSASLKLA